MQAPAAARLQVRVGPFTVDLASHELLNGERQIPLQEKPFQILAILLERPGELVTREELRRRIWPADTFVDFEHNINTAIRKLREAFADHPDEPRYIATSPRHGYRFIAPVSAVPEHRRSRIFVVPFVSLNGAEDESFGWALTERMIAQLEKSGKGIDVVAPTCIKHYKDDRNTHEICKETAASYLLAGSVLRSDGHFRITARLIRGEDQCCIWGDSYTRVAGEILHVQDNIAALVTRAIIKVLAGV